MIGQHSAVGDPRVASPAGPPVAGVAKDPRRAHRRSPLAAVGRDRWLWGALAVALLLRLAVRWVAPAADLLGDEREYYAAAAVLADGRGFSFVDQSLWIRPPLYIVLVAGLYRLFGPDGVLTAVWLAQVALSVATVALVYALGRLLDDRPVAARLAAGLCAVYLPFAAYTRLVLSETLFTFQLLGAFLALIVYARRGGYRPLLVAGAALGGAVLTRGIALPFLAAIPVWLVVLHRQSRPVPWGRVARDVALVLGIVAVLIAPWTTRNWAVHRALIPVETTGGYNFWLGALGGRDAGRIINTLREEPNQGRRQALAYARGWAAIRADPAGYLRKSVKEFRDLWAINFSAYERLVRGFGQGRVAPPWLALTLALDDLLYLAALPLAALGWTRLRRPEDRWLIGLWIAWSCLTGAVFFAIARFRFPILPFVFLLAALGVPALRQLGAAASRPTRAGVRRWLAPVLAAVTLIALVYPSFSPSLYRIGLTRAAAADRLAVGYRHLSEGRPDDARAAFERLPDDFAPRQTALAAVYHRLGQDERALALLDDGRDFPGAPLLRGDILRAQGREKDAFAAFNAREIDTYTDVDPAELAWARLSPPPRARLDVGDGLDLGYVRGVALRQRDADGTTYRWTGARAEVRLAAPEPAAGRAVLRLRLKSYRPTGAPPVVRVSVGGRPLGELRPDASWRAYELALDPALRGALVVRLETATFVPGVEDQRRLGAMLDWIELAPLEGGR